MKNCFKYKILSFTLLLIAIAVSCADIETETSGYLSLEVNLDDISNRKTGRSKLAESMTSSEAKTILAVLIPAVQCEASSASTNTEYSRALVDVNTHAAQFLVPLETQVKLCLYFYRETFSLDDLNTGNNTYKAVQRSSGAVAIGPIIQGLKMPVNDLSRGCLVEDIVYTIAITAIQAQSK